ncbi:hypothetical protein [Caldicoprobacter algeriensis]|uniref:hypothetical protein n=1 Tax=Caldicoprobacter algeriensis TaxID=699281 RepID=UPI00207AFA3D|nr:hypothetical protein [Caldicoprobacter algeriensis]
MVAIIIVSERDMLFSALESSPNRSILVTPVSLVLGAVSEIPKSSEVNFSGGVEESEEFDESEEFTRELFPI